MLQSSVDGSCWYDEHGGMADNVEVKENAIGWLPLPVVEDGEVKGVMGDD